MVLPTLRELMQAGVHFGHKTSRWNPNMAPYIFTVRSGVHVINLEETAKEFERACLFLRGIAAENKKVLFVGTKKQASGLVKSAALKAGMPYVNFRWLGGTLTNFEVIKNSIKQFQKENEIIKANDSRLTKREIAKLKEKVQKGEKFFGGLTELVEKPAALILVSAYDEHSALREAKAVGIPIVALCDTNSNPKVVDYPVPANDDATKSLELFLNLFAEVVAEGQREKKEQK